MQSLHNVCFKGISDIAVCVNTEGLKFTECCDVDLAIVLGSSLNETELLGLGATMTAFAPTKEKIDDVEKVLTLPDTLRIFVKITVRIPQKRTDFLQ